MAGTRKRKHAVAEDQQPSKQAMQSNIKVFASVKKGADPSAGAKKRKTVHESESMHLVAKVQPAIPMIADKKRKRVQQDVNGSDEEDTHGSAQQTKSVFKRFARREEAHRPATKQARDSRPPSPMGTPSKNTAALFDKLRLESAPAAIPFSLNQQRPGYETPPDTPDAEKQEDSTLLPPELRDLVQLHAAFLTAVSLYYAHNGTTSPANIGAILPMITKNFKKRSVTIGELQRLLAIGNQDFFLEDFGRAGICLSRTQPRGRALKRAASYIDETDMSNRFEEALQQAWLAWRNRAEGASHYVQTFIDQLPMLEIVKNASAEKAAPMFARGQQRLTDLKAGQAAAMEENVKASSAGVAIEQKTTQAVQNRGTSLLDRILAKQAATASMPAGPTKTQLERKAALHRIEAIARVLELLAAGKPRASFSMPVMVQQLQQSLRNPISREEVEQCLELMAGEITPGFVNVIMSGAVKGVVITRAGKVRSEELKARLEQAGA